MPYSTPKTNWEIRRTNTGAYAGDYLNASDYMRIVNNVAFLHDACQVIYRITIPETSMTSHTVNDVPLAADFNAIETNIQYICEKTFFPDSWSSKKTFYANGTAPGVDDWNRWERTIRAIKDRLDYDSQWIPFIDSDGLPFYTSDGAEFLVIGE